MFIQSVYAASLDSIYTPGAALGGQGATLDKLINPIITNVIVVSGIVAFLVIIFAGFSYISSAGDKAKLAQSTQMLNYGILGLILVVSAYLVTNILIGKILGFKIF